MSGKGCASIFMLLIVGVFIGISQCEDTKKKQERHSKFEFNIDDLKRKLSIQSFPSEDGIVEGSKTFVFYSRSGDIDAYEREFTNKKLDELGLLAHTTSELQTVVLVRIRKAPVSSYSGTHSNLTGYAEVGDICFIDASSWMIRKTIQISSPPPPAKTSARKYQTEKIVSSLNDNDIAMSISAVLKND